MTPAPTPFLARPRATALLVCAVIVAIAVVLPAQQNTAVPQPRADTLPAPGNGQSEAKPASADSPKASCRSVPAGFTVSVYAELPAPRMMVYAPNGDLFVSSPAPNTITVLRDANNDGVFEARRSTRRRSAPPRRRAAAGAAAGQARGGGARRRAAPPPPGGCGAPPVGPRRHRAGVHAAARVRPTRPGTLAAPFGLAFHDGYLYVGNTGSIVRYKYTNGDLKAQGEPEKLMDLPTGGHSTRNILFNRAGTKMYVAVGSQSNNDAGEDCRRAAILEFNPGWHRLSRVRVRHPQSGRAGAAAGTDIDLDRDQRARQSAATIWCPTTPRR